jgi:hypothetical protein
MSKNRDKKTSGDFKKSGKAPSAYKLAQMGQSGQSVLSPSDTIGLNAHPKHKR